MKTFGFIFLHVVNEFSLYSSSFKKNFDWFILFLAVLAFVALHGLSLVVAKGVLLIAVCRLLLSVAACCGALAPGLAGLSSCSMWLSGLAQELRCMGLFAPHMWDLPPVTERTSVPALAGRFLSLCYQRSSPYILSWTVNFFFFFAFFHIWGIHVQMPVFLRYIYSVPLVCFSGLYI